MTDPYTLIGRILALQSALGLCSCIPFDDAERLELAMVLDMALELERRAAR